MSSNFTITRRLEIDAAHRVPHHGSKCFAVHGHRYVIEAKCAGPTISAGEQTGMVMDFGFLKQCMVEVIHDPCDHGIILWKEDPIIEQLDLPTLVDERGLDEIADHVKMWKVYLIDKVPTAENLAEIWYWALNASIRDFFLKRSEGCPNLVEVKVWETPNCSAVYPW